MHKYNISIHIIYTHKYNTYIMCTLHTLPRGMPRMSEMPFARSGAALYVCARVSVCVDEDVGTPACRYANIWVCENPKKNCCAIQLDHQRVCACGCGECLCFSKCVRSCLSLSFSRYLSLFVWVNKCRRAIILACMQALYVLQWVSTQPWYISVCIQKSIAE